MTRMNERYQYYYYIELPSSPVLIHSALARYSWCMLTSIVRKRLRGWFRARQG